MVGAERKEMYLAKREAKAAADKFEKEIKKGGDIVDAVEDAVDDVEQVMSQGTKEMFQSFKMAKEDPTTMFVIKVADPSKAEEVKQLVTKYADTDHLDVFDGVVQFSASPGSDVVSTLNKIAAKIEALSGPEGETEDEAKARGTQGAHDVIIAALQKDLSRVADVDIEIIPPDEGEEDDMYGMEGNESYAANENEVQEDNEDLSAKKARAGKDIGKPGKNFAKIAKSAGKKYGSKAAGERVAGAVLAKMRGNYEGAEEFDDFDIGPQSDENVPDDYEEVLDALVDDDKKKHAMKKLNGDDDDPGHIDDMRAEYPPDPFGGGYEDEEGDAETHKLRRMAEDILGNLEDSGYRELAARGISGVDDDYDDDAIDMLYNLIDQGWTRGSKAFRLARRIVDFGRRGLEEGEERPMLDSYKTSTADYLTEQAASDKRNKKTKVKNQSFKERYKPKTHWQLEELRRYGL